MIFSLALGIGAANTVFSLLDGILLKPLAYVQPGQLAYLQEFVPALAHLYPELPVNFQHFRYWESHNQTFKEWPLSGRTRHFDRLGRTPGTRFRRDHRWVVRGAWNAAAMGRDFLAEEDQPLHSGAVIITDTLWRKRFHSDPDIIGRRILLGGASVTVGVLRPDFTFPTGNDLGQLAGLGKGVQVFQPVRSLIDGWDGDYDYIVVGRLRGGVPLSQGLAELTVLTRRLTAAHQVGVNRARS